jgi:hypothetical protein
MKRLFLIILIMTCSVSWAEWEIDSHDVTSTSYHDKSSIRKSGVITKMWTMTEYHELKIDRKGARYKSQKTLSEYNCQEQQINVSAITRYSGSHGSGSAIYSQTWQESERQWNAVIPGSIGEGQWQIACSNR